MLSERRLFLRMRPGHGLGWWGLGGTQQGLGGAGQLWANCGLWTLAAP